MVENYKEVPLELRVGHLNLWCQSLKRGSYENRKSLELLRKGDVCTIEDFSTFLFPDLMCSGEGEGELVIFLSRE